jgi:hypothetical protein
MPWLMAIEVLACPVACCIPSSLGLWEPICRGKGRSRLQGSLLGDRYLPIRQRSQAVTRSARQIKAIHNRIHEVLSTANT